MSTIGFLHSGSREAFQDAWKTLKENLPNDIEIKDKYANDDAGVLKKFARDLVNDRSVQAIVAAGGPQPALVLKELTKTIPIVFTTVANPVLSGTRQHSQKTGTQPDGNGRADLRA